MWKSSNKIKNKICRSWYDYWEEYCKVSVELLNAVAEKQGWD